MDTGQGDNLVISYLFLKYLNGHQYSGTATIESCQDDPILSSCPLQRESESEIFNLKPENSSMRIELNQSSVNGALKLYIPHMSGSPVTFKHEISGTVDYTPDDRIFISVDPLNSIESEENSEYLLDIQKMDLEMNDDILSGSLSGRLHTAASTDAAEVDYTIYYRKSL